MTGVKKTTGKFERKRIDILNAAAVLMNANGFKGMTFADVAQQVGLNTTSVTYYFRRKEYLAAATFDYTFDRMEAMIDQAAVAATPRERCHAYIDLSFDLIARIRAGRERPLAILSELRSLEDPLRSELGARYSGLFRKVRDFFDTDPAPANRAVATVRAHVFLENIYWLPAWISSYSATDFPRVQARFKEIFDHGLTRPGDHWQWDQLDLGEGASKDSTPEDFIRVATILINQLGYRGASVDRITAELNVTKGSFYHHLDAKDDLVMDCFERSYGYVSDAQRAAMTRGGGQPAQLAATMATLLATQLYQPFPLLRTTALQVIPSELRGSVIERSNRMALRFASMMIDGISEGSVRAVDPLIASQMIMATLNAAFELRHWAEAFEEADGISLYGSTLAYGLFDPAIKAPL